LTQLPTILLLSVFGCGMMVNTARAAWQTFRSGPAAFERTPKFGVRDRYDRWLGLRYQLSLDRIIYAELALAAVNAATSAVAVTRGFWAIAIYSGIFAAGLIVAACTTVRQTFRSESARRHEARQTLEPGLRRVG
jgi:hypothetical protein